MTDDEILDREAAAIDAGEDARMTRAAAVGRWCGEQDVLDAVALASCVCALLRVVAVGQWVEEQDLLDALTLAECVGAVLREVT